MKLFKLPDAWRILREVDLDAIRREAERPFQILIVADTRTDATDLARLLTGSGDGSIHPWLLPASPDEARRQAGSGLIDLAILLTRSGDLLASLAAARDVLVAARVPVVTVAHGQLRSSDAIVRGGESGRVAVAAIDAASRSSIVEAVLGGVTPGVRLAFAHHLPPLRGPVFDELIEGTARANAVYTLTTGLGEVVPVFNIPLNLADIVVLTKNQLVMSYRLALAAGKKGSARNLVGEVIGVIGSGFLFRQATRSLVGLIPGAGIVPKVAMAYAGTVAVGRAVAAWASEGHRLSAAGIKRLYRDAWDRSRQVAESLVASVRRKRPSGEKRA